MVRKNGKNSITPLCVQNLDMGFRVLDFRTKVVVFSRQVVSRRVRRVIPVRDVQNK